MSGTHVTFDEPAERQLAVAEPIQLPRWISEWFGGLVFTTLGGALLTVVLVQVFDVREILDVALLYLTFTLLVAAAWGYRVGIVAAALSNLLVNFFFIPPVHRFTVTERANVAALVLFLFVAMFGAWIVARLRHTVNLLRAHEAENRILLDVLLRSAEEPSAEAATRRFCEVVAELLGSHRCEIARMHEGRWLIAAGTAEAAVLRAADVTVAGECWRTDSLIGDDTREQRQRDSSGGLVFIPFPRNAPSPGVLRLANPLVIPPFVDRERLLRALAAQAALALQRLDMAAEAKETERLRVAESFKGTLLSTLSHDLRSPLTAIKAAVGNLRDSRIQWSPEDEARFLEAIETQTDRVTTLLTDLIELSHLEAGAIETRLEPVAVEELLADAANAAADTDRQIIVTVREPLWIAADYRLLMEAIGNLIENAARYSVPTGAIHIGATVAGSDVRISITDDGPGIPPEDLSHIFERFYRGVQTRKTTGTGLGLAITKALVELCDGTVEVTSSLGGTTFLITLPRIEAAP